ncbi:MAG: cytochrome c biogenesis protein CcsA [Anaerolineae bacterium]
MNEARPIDRLDRAERPNESRDRAERLLAAAAVGAAFVATIWVFTRSPEEATLRTSIRILYVHVGAAFTAYVAYAVTAAAALLFLWRRERRWDRVAVAAAEWSVVLSTITLVTGSIWARIASGWWWQWSDPRLTLSLLLWFVYIGYLLLRHATDGDRRAVLSAVLGVAAIPASILNHFATLLFRTEHPPPILTRPDGPAADPAIVQAVLLSLAAYGLIFAWGMVARVRLEAARDALADG